MSINVTLHDIVKAVCCVNCKDEGDVFLIVINEAAESKIVVASCNIRTVAKLNEGKMSCAACILHSFKGEASVLGIKAVGLFLGARANGNDDLTVGALDTVAGIMSGAEALLGKKLSF